MQCDFLTLGQRRLFLLSCQPEVFAATATVVLPAFAEEMNKTRHLLSACRDKVCSNGGSWFQLDPFGTGDSMGDLDETDVVQWRDDFIGLLNLLHQQGYQAVNFIAVRYGALQLFDLLAEPASLPLQLNKIVLWQPFTQAAPFLQQLFRLKVAEQMAVGEKTTQKELEQQLTAGAVLEIAGYPFTANFIDSVRQLRTLDHSCESLQSLCGSSPALLWLETSNLPNVGPATAKSLDALAAHFSVKFELLTDSPYWTSTELVANNQLIEQTAQFLKDEA